MATSAFEETYGLQDVEFDAALEAFLYFYLELEYPTLSNEPNYANGTLDVRDGDRVVEPILIGAFLQ